MEKTQGTGEMILVAITGSVCSGKSFMSKVIKNLGYQVFSCDEKIHKILKQKIILKKVKQVFSQAIVGNDISKKLLAEIIFNDLESRQKLEAILYPELFIRQDEFITKCKKAKQRIVFFEIPLLYEKNLQSKYSFVITTCAPKNILVKRADDKGMERKIFYGILKNQLSAQEKKKKANYVINTDCTENEIKEKIINTIKEILSLKE